MVDDLVELLQRPGGGAFAAQVIQNQQRDVADPREQFVVLDLAGRPEGAAQVVKQVGGGHEQGGDPGVDTVVGDGGSQVRLATTIAALQQEPALRIGGETLAAIPGPAQAADLLRRQTGQLDLETGEGLVGVSVQVAQAAQVVAPLLQAGLLPAARAGIGLAKAGIADRDVVADHAKAAAQRAGVRIVDIQAQRELVAGISFR